MEKKMLLLLLWTILTVSLATASFYYVILHYPHEVTVAGYNLEVYIDGTLWMNGTKINWGAIQPGTSTSKNLNVKNSGNVETTVALIVQNLPNGLTLTWTANETLLSVDGWANGTLILTVASDTPPATYSWDTLIVAY